MSNDWYLREDGETYGPYPKSQLVALAKSGRLSPTAKVRNGESGPWQRAAEVSGLFRAPEAPIGAKPARSQKNRPSADARAVPVKLLLLIGGGGIAALSFMVAIVWFAVVAVQPTAHTDGAAPAVAESESVPSDSTDSPPSVAPIVEAAAATEPTGDDSAASAAPSASESAPDAPATAAGDSRPASTGGDANAADDEPLLPLLAENDAESEPEVAAGAPGEPESRTRTDEQITEFNKRVKLNRKATDAYSQLKAFSTRYEFNAAQRVRLDLELLEWKKRADANLCRLGSKWVVERELLAAEQAAQQLMKSAAEQLESLNFKECIDLLKDASRVNPNGVRPDYTLGLLHSLPFAGVKAPETAERHFRAVLQRCPNHPAAFNSLAISQIKQREYSAAIGNLTKAAHLNPTDQEVIQNVGRFIMLAESGRLPPPPDNVVRRCRTLYKELTSSEGAPEFEARTGWLHMLPVFPSEGTPAEKSPQKPQETAPTSEMVPRFSGTGFIIAPGFVLTNRHVVDDTEQGLGAADEVRTIDPADPGRQRELRGKIVVVSPDTDLALVRFEGLQSAPVAFENTGIELASDVLIMGFPQTQLLGSGLKTTRGIVSALPDTSRAVVPEYVLFDAAADHGNSGGPVLNRQGRAVAVLTVVVNTGSGLSGGVTAESALAFVKQHVPDFQDVTAAEDSDVELSDWAAVTRILSPSVLQLTCYYEAGVPELNVAASRAHHSGNVYEDQTCPWCNGRDRVTCPHRGCVSGRISVPYYVDDVVGAGPNPQVITRKKFRKERCPNCDGHGAVDCIGCSNGFDSELR